MYAIRSYYDENGALLKMLTDLFGSDVKENLPLVLLSDSKGDIYLFSSGYKIGIGEHRITSYNVCYTKLLRSAQWNDAVYFS